MPGGVFKPAPNNSEGKDPGGGDVSANTRFLVVFRFRGTLLGMTAFPDIAAPAAGLGMTTPC